MEKRTQFQKDLVRMWDSMRDDDHKGEHNCLNIDAEVCKTCPLTEVCENDDLILFEAEKAIEIVADWAYDHPIFTREDKYREVFGVEPKDNYGVYICPRAVGFSHIDCRITTCAKCRDEFWNSEYKEPKKEGE